MFTLNCRGRLLVAAHPLVMGIVNITPDSFYKESRFTGDTAILRQVEKMLSEGADIIDIGAQSTRPDAILLSSEEELTRITDRIFLLHNNFPDAVFSVDTFYSEVAKRCVEAGAGIVNDVSGGQMDTGMITAVGKLDVPYVCMHMRGSPQTMKQHIDYDEVTGTVLEYFMERIEKCRLAGIKDIILDPGFGFSKNIPQNFELLSNLSVLKIPGRPLLAGLSRKSTIYKTLGITTEEALNGTTVMNTIALMNGADIIRVHDVREARECVKLFSML